MNASDLIKWSPNTLFKSIPLFSNNRAAKNNSTFITRRFLVIGGILNILSPVFTLYKYGDKITTKIPNDQRLTTTN